MQSSLIKLISFSVSNWIHLYSLEQAIQKQHMSGASLSINGKIRNCELLANQYTPIDITFNKAIDFPQYPLTDSQAIVLGTITQQENKITSSLPVDEDVFNELRKNLMEYADIDGIHIIVTLGVLLDDNQWPVNETLKLVKLEIGRAHV